MQALRPRTDAEDKPQARSPPVLAPERRLTLIPLVCVMFFITCGGAFGLEPLVGAVGPAWAIALILATPLFWSAPIALMTAELTSLIPEEGGFYVWVRQALGQGWAVQEGWWSIGYTVALMASFPVLFVNYLAYFFPAIGSSGVDPQFGAAALVRWLIAVLVIGSAMAVNLLGARDVGRSARVSVVVVVGTFAAFVLFAFVEHPQGHLVTSIRGDFVGTHGSAILLGLSIIVWNFSGYDNVSTFAAEVDEPQRTYPRAIAGALLLAVLAYLVPVLAGLSITRDPIVWSAGKGWPAMAEILGGRWLAALMAAAGMVSMWGLFNAMLLFVSRIPCVMARDGWLPAILGKSSSTTTVPRVAIMFVCAIAALLAIFPFAGLAVLQCLLYTAALILELVALIVLRQRNPGAQRSFRIPYGRWGLAYVCGAPLIAAAVVLFATFRDWRSFSPVLVVAAGVVVSGALLYSKRRVVAARCEP